MIKSNEFKLHSISLSALFILGNAVILSPNKNANEFTFLSFLAVALFSVAVYLLCLPLYERLLSKNSKWRCIIFLGIAVFSFWVASDAFYNSFSFISKVILPETAKPLIIIVFLAVILFFAFRRQEEVLKFCLLAFIFTVLAVLFFFFASLHNYNAENIMLFSLPDFKTLITQTKPYFLNPFLSLLLLPVYFKTVFEKINRKSGVLGVGLGYIVLGICLLSAILLFGPYLAGKLDYPFASAVSTVTIGKLFTRMDGFAYFIYFCCALVKITVCLFITFSMLKRIRQCF